ncbi:serine/threonine protein kinase [Planifilum fulgidum]|jgi:serine/threonine protein kinase|uniref:Serine/threonine-protein kinase PrkC n=2 Tax=Planifilum fulgidum TaxID=201973 RepID=A0A1I2R4U8_9BACL|nr:Stk1 family PASTA domain-containing Ser/Thr kinase [Planifilum fulgidum]SFG35063.1 serine/threonine protein kinase [Planifilum fulgidum]
MTMSMEGRKLGGRYEILYRVGGGGMAVVYKAKDLLLNRYVAIKVMNESLSNDTEFIRRFSREAQAAASLSHPNVVNVYDVGREGHIHYIVMEYVEGPTLKEYIQESGPLPPEEAVYIATQICDALAHAHDNQIIHRDIKPHNILLGYNGRVKVTDFGIARAATSSTITQTGSVMGSVHYFSPEQARGGVIGEKSDLYSLGIVMYEMVTGELPFDGDSAIGIALKHLQEQAVEPRQLRPDLPDDVNRVILKALEKDPNQRFASARAMMQELQYILHGMDLPQPGWVQNASRIREEEARKPAPNREEEAEIASKEPRDIPPVGEKTLSRLERLRHAPADKEKTLLQRTVVWLENARANMPWWQKVLFGMFTFAVIITLSILGFNAVMGIFTGGDDTPPASANPNTVKMADLTGKQLDEAKKWLKDNGFGTPKVKVEQNGKYKHNEVIDQSPSPGERVVPRKTQVTLTVNSTENMIEVDNFKGLFQSRIQSEYMNKGYHIEFRWWDFGVEKGKAWAQDPAPGEYVKPGDTVYVWISVPGKNIHPPPGRDDDD